MPALSPTMTKGNIANWVKKEGTNCSFFLNIESLFLSDPVYQEINSLLAM
jgi:hypothetical protein